MFLFLSLSVCVLFVYSGQIVGERGETAFPFRFWRGNAVPLAYTTTVGGQATEKMCVKCMI